ncbi:transmembrane protein, putative (macronuclear) [Tetrahymena thermophila SB210]|uniref:Transmembrane protein, putative n=1 Tax=Tetrahymena thermophila (strain SB210) TaxID=312017 RepID=Q233X2_TETTS|nr:transmembrane protein, putative [Tetrahymena thermophila SB210]EAR91812.1 transmembrane protein, putative [Tetrahymena thermophila SB210]|eukprot:XP_001012057.1 transmembrane protein, putative [Tetrahymena thermophila SB210]
MEQILKDPFQRISNRLSQEPSAEKDKVDQDHTFQNKSQEQFNMYQDNNIKPSLNVNNKQINRDENYFSGVSDESGNAKIKQADQRDREDLFQEGDQQSYIFGENLDRLFQSNRNASSFVSDSDYFKQDSCDFDCILEKNKTNKSNLKQIENSNIYASWIWTQFFEFFFYHLIYFIFGPFCIIFFYPFNGLFIYKNLRFGILGKFSYYQLFLWFLNLCFTISYFASKKDRATFEFFLLYNNWILLVFRIFSISCRYAMLHPYQIELYRTTYINKEEENKDFYLSNWKLQDDECVMEELYFASKRDEVDVSMFYCSFFQDINSNEIRESLDKIKKLHNEFYKQLRNKIKVTQKADEKSEQQEIKEVQEQNLQQKNYENPIACRNSYNGIVILHYLINQFSKLYPIYTKFYIPLFFAFLRSIIWIVYFSIYNQSRITSLEWYECILGSQLSLFNFLIYFLVVKFLLSQIADIHRIYYLNIQMLFLIKPKKDEKFICYKKVLPTLNVICYDTYKNWIQLRRLTIEYGKRFWLRGQANASFMLLYSLYPIIFIFLHLLDIFRFCNLNLWYLVFDFVVIFSFISISLYYTASINYQFIYHTQILEEIRIIFRNLVREDFIFQNDEFCSYLYRALLRKLRIKFDNNKQFIIKRIKAVIQQIDNVKNELVLLQNSQPFEFFGITITFTMLKNSILFMISLLTFAVNVYIKTHKS